MSKRLAIVLAATIIACTMFPLPIGLIGLIALVALPETRALFGKWSRGNSVRVPAVPTRLEVLRSVDRTELAPLFGRGLPANWRAQMIGLLALAEAVAHPLQNHVLDRAEVRARWALSPVPELHADGAKLLSDYRTVLLTKRSAELHSRSLTVVLINDQRAELTLSWTVACEHHRDLYTLTAVSAG